MCSFESDSYNLNSSISDEDDSIRHRLEQGGMFASKSSPALPVQCLSSPLGSKQLKVISDKNVPNIDNMVDIKPAGSKPLEESYRQEERSLEMGVTRKHGFDSNSTRKRSQRPRNNELIKKLSPGQGRVKDSIARNHLHLSNFLAAGLECLSSSSSSSPSADRSLDLSDIFHTEGSPESLPTARHLENNAVRVEATGPNAKNDNSEEGPHEKQLAFDKIRIRTHDTTESERHLDWNHNNNSESFVLDDYEKRRLEKKKKQKQRRPTKHKHISVDDTVSEDLEIATKEENSNETQEKRRVGSLAALQCRNEPLEEDVSSLPSGRSDKSSSSRVSFGDVRVRRHVLTLGDHPCVSQGPPVALDWAHMSSQHFDLEDYEQIAGDRQKAQRISREEREELLRTKGISDDSLSRIELEVQQIKASRQAVKNDKKREEDDIMIYKLLSSTTLREARLSSRQSIASAEVASKQKPRRTSFTKRSSESHQMTAENDVKQSAKPVADDSLTSSEVSPKLSSQRWRMSLKNLFRMRKSRAPVSTDVLPVAL